MKLLLLISIFLFLQCFAVGEKVDINNISDYYTNSCNLNILDKKYTCYDNNCYDLNSYRYNKFTKTHYIDTIMDLMRCNAHEEYQSPYGDGYISHLIIQTKLHNNKIDIKCKGFVVGEIIVDYENGKASSAHYNIIAIHRGKPKTMHNIKEFESISLDKEDYIIFIKNLVNI